MNSILMSVALLLAQVLSGSSIEGLVVKEGTNEPIRGAQVRLGTGPAATSVITDDGGRFRFQNVSPGMYGISVSHPDYVPAAFGQRGPNRPGRQILVAAGQDLKDIVVRLTASSAIFGRVFTPDKQPAGNVPVQLLRYLYFDGRRMLAIEKETRTDDAGEYRFSAVTPMEYAVGAEVLSPGAPNSLHGTPVYFPGTVDPDAAATINVLPGIEYGGLDLTLIEQDAVHIRGRIVDLPAGTTPASFFLMLSPRDRRTLIAGDTAPRKISVGPDGAFSIEAVAPGFYDFIATRGDGAQRHAARIDIDARGDVDDFKVELQPGFELQGKVTVEGFPGADISGITVRLIHEPYITQVSPAPVLTQSDGSFLFSGVLPGDYRIAVTTKWSSAVVFARLGSRDILNFAMRVDSGDAGLFDIHLKPNATALDVTVVDERNAPADGVQVTLVPEGARRARLEIYETAQTDRLGNARFLNIEPGLYKVFAWEYLESGKWQDADFIAQNEHLGTTVRIEENAAERVSLRVHSPSR